MSHLEIIKKAYTECGIVFRVFSSQDFPDGSEILIKTGDNDDEYEGLTYYEALNKCKSFIEFLNGEIASY